MSANGHWRRRPAVIGTLALTVVVACGSIAAFRWGAPPARSAVMVAPSAATTKVLKTNLSDSSQFSGTLGFGTERPITGGGGGIITRLPEVGTTVKRGKALYWVDDQPVPVMFGTTPFFRALDRPGLRGSDVRVLENNLRSLGYPTGKQPDPGRGTAQTPPGGAPQATFTPALMSALKRWQHDVGLSATGTLRLGQVVVLPGPSRVSALHVQPGAAATGELLGVTDLTRMVTVPMGVTETENVVVGAKVSVTLPDGKQIAGRVASISHVVSSPDQGDSDNTPPKVNVIVTPLHAEDVRKIDAADVNVTFTTTVHKGVLAVPVSALVALREGGYALQRVTGSYLPVKTGMFAQGMVEVEGAGVAAGLEVVTTS